MNEDWTVLLVVFPAVLYRDILMCLDVPYYREVCLFPLLANKKDMVAKAIFCSIYSTIVEVCFVFSDTVAPPNKN